MSLDRHVKTTAPLVSGGIELQCGNSSFVYFVFVEKQLREMG